MYQQQKRIFMTLTGIILVGFSVALLKLAAWGVDPFTCFCTGISNVLHISYGLVFTLVSSILFIGIFLIKRRYIGIATILNMFGIGFLTDLFLNSLKRFIYINTIYHQLILLFIGIIILCFASSLYFTADLGVSVYDAVSLIISDKKQVSFRTCRIFTDSICVLIGFFLQSPIGIGTIITALFMGPLIQFFNISFSQPLLYKKNKIAWRNL